MTTGEWVAVFVALAGLPCAAAAVPQSAHRWKFIGATAAFLLIAAAIALAPMVWPRSEAEIVSPDARQSVSATVPQSVSGTVGDIAPDTLWLFEDRLIDGKRVWIFGGQTFVGGGRFSIDFEPTVRVPGTRATLVLVRATPECDRQLRAITPDADGRRIVSNVPLAGCSIVDNMEVSISG
jgi:hypothetical protein